MAQQQTRSKRFERLAEKDINKEVFISELPELGLIIMDSPDDPEPSIRIQNGRSWRWTVASSMTDVIDHFIAKHGIDLIVAQEAMAMPTRDIARMLVDINVTQREVMRIMAGCTPAKLVAIMTELNVVEMMMAMQKMRQRRQPADQAHVTNWKENPALLAADAAEAGLGEVLQKLKRLFAARNAPFNALALLVGSQVGRSGVMTQISAEEALSLRLAMKGLSTYAETFIGKGGTIPSFLDGDDTPWSKGILVSAYASRGVKSRFTSGLCRSADGLWTWLVYALPRSTLHCHG